MWNSKDNIGNLLIWLSIVRKSSNAALSDVLKGDVLCRWIKNTTVLKTPNDTTKQTSISKMKLYVVCKNMEKLVDLTSYSPITKQSSHSPQIPPSLSSMQMSRMVCPTLVLLAALLALAASQGFYPQRYGKRPDPRQLTGKLLSSLVLYMIWGILHSSWTSHETNSCKCVYASVPVHLALLSILLSFLSLVLRLQSSSLFHLRSFKSSLADPCFLLAPQDGLIIVWLRREKNINVPPEDFWGVHLPDGLIDSSTYPYFLPFHNGHVTLTVLWAKKQPQGMGGLLSWTLWRTGTFISPIK